MTISWDVEPDKMLEQAIERYLARLRRGVREIAARRAPEIAAWMKQNHPWQNITGAAEAGLHTTVEEVTTDLVNIVLAHGDDVPHGYWLEAARSGRWGVLLPAVDVWGPVIMQDIRKLVGG